MKRKLSDYIGEAEPPGRGKGGGLSEEEVKRIVEATVAEFLEPLLGEIRGVRERLERIEGKLDELLHDRARREQRDAQAPQGGLERDPARRLVEQVKREGYMYASTARSRLGLSEAGLAGLVEKAGLVLVDLNGDYSIMTRESYEEFLSLLASIETSDPEEAVNLMGRYRDLFSRLRRVGSVYFDSSAKSWRLLK